ncbi:iron uptake porin [Planktothricoides raciborskii]|uniref:Iron uptake porin n=1 Tax=Planktothricoides raciborskii GIHE-MW2 TaxID=2792601 RepID=A0AAU8JAT8_9CYAN
MSKKSPYFWLTKPAIVSASLLLATSAIASEPVSGSGSATNENASINSILNQVEEYNPINLSQGGDDPLQRVNSVNQLRDVRPTDWAYTALQNLAERHGCLLAYPNGEYRGNRAMTRYEFAAGLDACLEQIQRQLANLDTGVSRSDLEALQRLQEEFAGELTVLRRRVDALEVRTAELEANQFSTTTKLFGESIFALVAADGGSATNADANGEFALGTRTRLNFDTSFSGQDLLRTRLQVATLDSFAQNNTFTPEGDLMFNAGLDQDGDTSFRLSSLLYSTNLGDKTRIAFIANAGAVNDFASTVVPMDGDGGSGAVSRFGTRPPIYNLVSGSGVGLTYDAGKAELSLGYLAGNDNLGRSVGSPLPQNGLFDGPYGAIAQLVFKPVDGLKVGLTYVNAYNKDTQTGSIFATPVSSIGFTTSTNAYGLQFGYETADMPVKLGGWLGYTDSNIKDSGLDGDMAAWNWAVTLGVDAGPPGSQLGLIVGMEPKVTSSDGALAGLEDSDTSLHIEGFYEYQLSNNISVTPAFVWLTAPDHNSNNDDLVIGTLRTTFRF